MKQINTYQEQGLHICVMGAIRYNGKMLISVVSIGGIKMTHHHHKEAWVLIRDTCDYLIIWQGMIKLQMEVCSSIDLEMGKLSWMILHP